MSKKKKNTQRISHPWLKLIISLSLLMLSLLFAVDRIDLPASFQNNSAIVAVYEWRDNTVADWRAKKVTYEKNLGAPQVEVQTGYSSGARSEMDNLISRGTTPDAEDTP